MAFIPRATRFHVTWPLVASHPHRGQLVGRVVNISTSGLLFLTDEPYPIGEAVDLEIRVRPGEAIRCTATIVREQEFEEDRFCYGAQFGDFCGEDRRKLGDELLIIRRSLLDPTPKPAVVEDSEVEVWEDGNK